MGIESRDWYRDEARRRASWGSRALVVFGLFLAALGVLVLSPTVRSKVGVELPFGLEEQLDKTPGTLQFEPIPGLDLMHQPLYAKNDPWKAWLASESVCPRGEDGKASAAVQTQVMLCLLNYARAHEGLQPLEPSKLLSRSAAAKAVDIQRCGKFEHEACGKPVNQVALDLGYTGSFGENLYVAERPLTVPRVAVDQWLNSDGHRHNLFRPEWRTVGIAALDGANVEAIDNGVIWVNQFGG
jgi:uncharacterized protein YkwD